MKCAVIVSCLVVAVVARPQAPPAEDPTANQVLDIAAEYERFHQIWLAEAQRNAVAPLNPHKPATQEPAQEPVLKEEPVVVVEPVVVEEPAVAEAAMEPEVPVEAPVEAAVEVFVTSEAPVASEGPAAEVSTTPAPDMNLAFAEFERLWLAEAARNAIAPTVGPQLQPQQAIPVEQTPVVMPTVQEELQPEPLAPTPALTNMLPSGWPANLPIVVFFQ